MLLFGLAGLFGKTLALSSSAIVAGRAGFAAVALLAVIAVGRTARGRLDWQVAPLGVLLAVHWVTFFEAIQVSTVAVGLLSFASFPVFVALIEPLVSNERFRAGDLVLASVAMLGVGLVIGDVDLSSSTTRGGLWGVASGLTFAVLTIANRRLVATASAVGLALVQNAVAAAVLVPFVGGELSAIAAPDLIQLAALGVVFTALPHTLFISAMRGVSARYASLSGSLEPVYGVAAAALVLGEIPDLRTMAGGAVILGVVVFATTRR